MQIITLLVGCAVLNTVVEPSWAITNGEHSAGFFCYLDSEGCGPSYWGAMCRLGRSQSPIHLTPTLLSSSAKTIVKLSVYKGESFRMVNNGHSVQLDFNKVGPSNEIVLLPDPGQADAPYIAMQNMRQYKFSSIHFHWGENDYTKGSEHCILGTCSAMEIHFVHYLAKYPSQAAAVASQDPNALAVIGLLVDALPFGSVADSWGNGWALGPIVRNLRGIQNADTRGEAYKTFNQPLDLSKLLFQASRPWSEVYTYKGSLTTPGCNEQVNWYVLKNRASTSHNDLETFRTILRDGRGKPMSENNRPLQPINGRKVILTEFTPY